MAVLPKASTPVLMPNGLMTPEWYRLFNLLVGDANALTGATGTAATMPGNPTGSAAPDVRLNAAAVKTFLALVAGDVSGLAAVATAGTYASLTGTWSFVDAICGVIVAPTNQDYVVGLNMPFAFVANTMTTIATGGTCTLVTNKNTTAVTGLSNAVSTSEVTTTATAGNAYAVGDDVRLTVSANASCVNLAFCLKITRTLP